MTEPLRTRFVRLCFRLGLPPDLRDAVAGDLEELYRSRRVADGRVRSAAWLLGQTVWFVVRFLPTRIADGFSALSAAGAPSWLDFRLGARMLTRTPLLTVTGCLAIATAIGLNAGFHEFMHDVFSPSLSIPDANRVVGIINRDLETGRNDRQILEDLPRWRERLETVESVGAAISRDLNLVASDGTATPVRASEIHASAFGLGGIVPVEGRPLLPTDDGPDAAPVAVISQGLWQSRLGGDPAIVGRTVHVGDVAHTVVGIAPSDFSFPVYRDVWLNFRRDLDAMPPREGPPALAFGRLAPGHSLRDAEAELNRLGLDVSAELPRTHARVRPVAMPIAEYLGPAQAGLPPWLLTLARSFFVLLILVASANVATLVFARTAGRGSEIAVRSALGAGRLRIVTQLVAEALVLALVSAGIGLAVAEWGLRFGSDVFWEVQRIDPPAWWHPGLSASTIGYSLVLAVVGAAVIGVLPALRATREGRSLALRQSTSGGGALRFGIVPTAVIVVQVALSVAFVPIVLAGGISNLREQVTPASFDTSRFLSARLRLDGSPRFTSATEEERRAALQRVREEVGIRLRAEPGVGRVAFGDRLPGLMGQSIPGMTVEIEGMSDVDDGHVMVGSVDGEWFGIVGREVLDGRALSRADHASENQVAVVNRYLAEELFGGRNPVGQRIRAAVREGDDPDRPWVEIVGMMPDEISGPTKDRPHVWLPLRAGEANPLRLAVEVEGDPSVFASRLSAVVAEVEPAILVDEVLPIDRVRRGEVMSEMYFVVLTVFFGLATLLLTTTGTYSLMSFLVSQRTREIGIRIALGARPALVARDVFRRAMVQLFVGAFVGMIISTGLYTRFNGIDGGKSQELWLTLIAVTAFVVTVGVAGTAVPVRRGLRIQPTEALRSDG